MKWIICLILMAHMVSAVSVTIVEEANMTDIVLRIYSGSGASWAETLDYEITGVLDYNITDESGYAVDRAWFKVEDINHVLADGIDPDYDTSVQVWRAYNSDDGKLISSGVVTKLVEHASTLEIFGEGMNSLFKRVSVRDYTMTGDGSLKYTSVLNHATNGLIQGSSDGLLPATDYKAFDITTHLVAGSNLIPTGQELKYDNMMLYDVVVDVCKKAVGANDRHLDCYLFEMDDNDETVKPTLNTADTDYKMCLYLKERRSTASAKTLDAGDVDVGRVKWSNQKGGEGYFNKVIIRGAFTEVNKYPSDGDWWTEDDDPNDRGWTDTDSTISAQAGVYKFYGDYCVSFKSDDGAGQVGWLPSVTLDFTDAEAQSTTYVPEGDDWDNSTGYQLNFDKEQYLSFYIRVDGATKSDIDDGECNLMLWIVTDQSSTFSENVMVRISGTIDLDSGTHIANKSYMSTPIADEYYKVDLRLADYLISTNTYCDALVFGLWYPDGDDCGDTRDVFIDKLCFYTRDYQVEGSATKSGVTSNFKELLIELPELDNDKLCELIAGDALKEQDQLQNGGVIPVLGPFRDVSLRAGNTIEIAIDGLGLDVRAGADGAVSFELEKIIYSPYRQTLHVGRNMSAGEMAEAMKSRAYRSFNRRR